MLQMVAVFLVQRLVLTVMHRSSFVGPGGWMPCLVGVLFAREGRCPCTADWRPSCPESRLISHGELLCVKTFTCI